MAFIKLKVKVGQAVGTNASFPTLVQPSLITGLGSITLAEAQSARFYSDVDKTTELAREVVMSDEIHVKVTSMEPLAEIWMDYDSIRSDYGVGATYGRNNVWSADAGVWHTSQSSGAATDSTSNGNDATNTSVDYAAAKIGNGAEFNATTDVLYVGDPTALRISGALSFGFWIKGNNPSGLRSFLCKGGVSGVADTGWGLMKYSGGALTFWVGSGSAVTEISISNALANADFFDNVWHKISCTYVPSTSINLYLDGVLYATNTTSVVSSLATNKGVSFGQITTAQSADARDSFIGSLDEIRIRAATLTANWITTEYNNQNANGSFWEATDAGGGGSTPAQVARRGAIMMM